MLKESSRKEGAKQDALCAIDGCARKRKYKSSGWCQTHYHRWYRTGQVHTVTHGAKPLVELTYRGTHFRIARELGPAEDQECIRCGSGANEWAYDGTDPTHKSELIAKKWPVNYSVYPELYMPLCWPCHRLMDASARAARRTHCRNNHEMTAENTYERPSRPGTRECKTCRGDNSKARYLNRLRNKR